MCGVQLPTQFADFWHTVSSETSDPFLEVAVTKRSGNFKELMILLGFLPPTSVIVKLFHKRAAAPIIKITPLFLQQQYFKETRNPLIYAQWKGANLRGIQVSCLRDKCSCTAWCQVPKSRAGSQTPVLVYLQALESQPERSGSPHVIQKGPRSWSGLQ